MSKMRIVRAVAAVCLVASVYGCGGDNIVKVEQSTQITKGWELKDLQKALDADAINKSEYDIIKKKILKRSN